MKRLFWGIVTAFTIHSAIPAYASAEDKPAPAQKTAPKKKGGDKKGGGGGQKPDRPPPSQGQAVA